MRRCLWGGSSMVGCRCRFDVAIAVSWLGFLFLDGACAPPSNVDASSMETTEAVASESSPKQISPLDLDTIVRSQLLSFRVGSEGFIGGHRTHDVHAHASGRFAVSAQLPASPAKPLDAGRSRPSVFETVALRRSGMRAS